MARVPAFAALATQDDLSIGGMTPHAFNARRIDPGFTLSASDGNDVRSCLDGPLKSELVVDEPVWPVVKIQNIEKEVVKVSASILPILFVASSAFADLRVTNSFIKDDLVLGEPILQLVSLANTGKESSLVPSARHMQHSLRWNIAPAGLTRDARRAENAPGLPIWEPLAAGETRTFYIWNENAWIAESPGTYSIELVYDTTWWEGDGPKERVVAPKVSLTLREPTGVDAEVWTLIKIGDLSSITREKYPQSLFVAWGFYLEAFRHLPELASSLESPRRLVGCVGHWGADGCPAQPPSFGPCTFFWAKNPGWCDGVLPSRSGEPFDSLALCLAENRFRTTKRQFDQAMPFLKRASKSTHPLIRERAQAISTEVKKETSSSTK